MDYLTHLELKLSVKGGGDRLPAQERRRQGLVKFRLRQGCQILQLPHFVLESSILQKCNLRIKCVQSGNPWQCFDHRDPGDVRDLRGDRPREQRAHRRQGLHLPRTLQSTQVRSLYTDTPFTVTFLDQEVSL